MTTVENNQKIAREELEVYLYDVFFERVKILFKKKEIHLLSYFAFVEGEYLHFVAAIGDDLQKKIHLLSHIAPNKKNASFKSISAHINAFQMFEREIAENFGVVFEGHPWAKPVRYAHDRSDKSLLLETYPFFHIGGSEIHEVGVGPIHAGVIEPGHFRFLCHGEIVKHLEIQLGYQHRGVENLFLQKKHPLQRTILAESIAGDSTIGHNLAFINNMEALYGIENNHKLELLRSLALELERIAIHVGDLSAFALDVAYQLGNAVFGALRTPIINFLQLWCGNRFGKGLLRIAYNPFPFTPELRNRLISILNDFEFKYNEMAEKTFQLPSVLNRFEKTGILTQAQAHTIGAVGMSARMTGLARDIRASHPFDFYKYEEIEVQTTEKGDVWSRGMLRHLEIKTSIKYIRKILERLDNLDMECLEHNTNIYSQNLASNSICISLTEGWRGEICHVAVTNSKSELIKYKITDPSFHNWLGLALVLRENEISDFPICNKSFNLSYCGFDL